MSLSISESESAFLHYCLAYGGAVPHFAMDNLVIAAAIALGAEGRAVAEKTMRVHEVATAVEAMLGEDAPEAPSPAADHDPTQAALEAYAEGAAAELEALEKWEAEERTRRYGDESHQALLNCLRAFIASRRASAPKRGMTAADVVTRIAAWYEGTVADADCGNLRELTEKIRRELEGATR